MIEREKDIGLQNKIIELNPRVSCVPCTGHRLNLVVNAEKITNCTLFTVNITFRFYC